ncbi:hypothetical protein PQE68_gp237 [Bacillus phage vB_BanS_Sophrita]|uniref:Uncharacterized protein n=1 Tax=Bacillus phage vB_BanS_Sophrita TaxID=2894790 RepID=A0AAE8YV07_9CAUD|nr:hypothetical protein PQE68_gp237 [Bacillus phage vB_BanS_Sophrita]UGO50845.1 hypothetical protein SOPHRITA_258 [Bacillus phage vB_BanS_Sophrita]
MFDNILIYSTEQNTIGNIVEISLLKKTYTIETEEENHITVTFEDAVPLQFIGEIDEVPIYNGDVFTSKQGLDYEIEIQENGAVVFHELDKKYNRVKAGVPFYAEDLHEFEEHLDFFENIHVLKGNKPKIDFKVQVVRQVINGEVEYAYACNNKLEEEIDLISVVFMGHQLLEEATGDYTRVSLPYDGYLDSIERGLIKEVKPQELANYVTGLMYGRNPEISTEGLIVIGKDTIVADEGIDIEKVLNGNNPVAEKQEEGTNICKCGSHPADCDCDLWTDK